MGRLPKGFSVKKQTKEAAPAAPAEQQQQADGPSPSAQQQASSKPQPQPQQQKQPEQQSSGDARNTKDHSDDEGGSEFLKGPETRGHVIQRHKREMQAFKKNLQRMGKKSKDELAAMTREIEERHTKEMQEVEQREKQAEGGAQGIEGLKISSNAASKPAGAEEQGEEHQGGAGGKTKAMKRREKVQREQAEREARIAAEAAAAGPSARAQEEEALSQLLAPLGLKIREIKADGHCLYRSLEDQLRQALQKHAADAEAGPVPTHFQQLREAAAAHIRAHPEDYMPFIPEEDHAGAQEEGLSPLEHYCRELESTASWGGQLELSVLAQVLKRPIQVYAVGSPTITLGEEFSNQKAPLQVCYLRHAFGLGEHYNSLEPVAEETSNS